LDLEKDKVGTVSVVVDGTEAQGKEERKEATIQGSKKVEQ